MTEPARQLLPRPERRQLILEAAARAFGRGGYKGTSMTRLAEEAGVTKLIVYRHFDSKSDLYRKVLERTLADMRRELAEAVEQGSEGPLVRSVLNVGRRSPDALRLLFVHALREPEFAEHAEALRDRVVQLWIPRMPMPDPLLKRWAAELAVCHVWDAVRIWLDVGDSARDEELVRRCSSGLYAMLQAWQADAGGARARA